MNEYDSDFLAQTLIQNGFSHESDVDRADVILINTCAVRAKPEQKACSFLGRMADLKRKNPWFDRRNGRMPGSDEGKGIDEKIPPAGFCPGPKGTGPNR